MAITLQQLKSLGFLPAKRSSLYKKKYDTLIFPLNKTDHLYLGYNQYSKEVSYKSVWKSFKHPETNERITYKVINLGETGFDEMKEFLRISKENANYQGEQDDELDNGSMQTYTIDPSLIVYTRNKFKGMSNNTEEVEPVNIPGYKERG